MAEKVRMTAEEKTQLEAELFRLRNDDEPDILQQMQAAAAQGDLRENFAYHDSRQALGMLRGRIKELEQTIENAEISQTPMSGAVNVQLGSTITVREVGTKDDEMFMIVSEAMGAKGAKDGKMTLSTASPMGSALINKKVGDVAEFTAPNGKKLKFEVVKVH